MELKKSDTIERLTAARENKWNFTKAMPVSETVHTLSLNKLSHSTQAGGLLSRGLASGSSTHRVWGAWCGLTRGSRKSLSQYGFYDFLNKYFYLFGFPGLSCGMQTLSCGMWDLVP